MKTTRAPGDKAAQTTPRGRKQTILYFVYLPAKFSNKGELLKGRQSRKEGEEVGGIEEVGSF